MRILNWNLDISLPKDSMCQINIIKNKHEEMFNTDMVDKNKSSDYIDNILMSSNDFNNFLYSDKTKFVVSILSIQNMNPKGSEIKSLFFWVASSIVSNFGDYHIKEYKNITAQKWITSKRSKDLRELKQYIILQFHAV